MKHPIECAIHVQKLRRPRWTRVTLCLLATALLSGIASAETPALTLSDALALALEKSPQLAPFAWDMRIAEARVLQAGLRPNPEISLEVEGIRWRQGPGETTNAATVGFGLDGGAIGPVAGVERETVEGGGAGFSEAEFTLRLTQLVELGGKRAKRVYLATQGIETARWDYEIARADVLTDVTQAFAETLAAQLKVELTGQLVQFAEEVARTAESRVQAGKASPLELRKAKVEVTTATVDRQRATRELEAARFQLAAAWGDSQPGFDAVAGQFDDVTDLPALVELGTRTLDNPDIARWAAELERRSAAFRVEQSRRFPDLTLTLGLRASGVDGYRGRQYGLGVEGASYSAFENRTDRDWDTSLVFEVSVPLPLFDRNQGNIREAECLVEKAADERRAAKVEVGAALAQWYHLATGAKEEVAALDTEAIPEATQTFELTQEGFRQGKFQYLDVLDSQRTLFDLRIRQLDAKLAYHRGRIEIERLIGAIEPETDSSLSEIQGVEK